MYTVEQALRHILDAAPVMEVQRVSLSDCSGRVLAADIEADIALPPFDNSAVDGYALRAADTRTASPHAPALFTCVDDISAGSWPQKSIGAGECARIMTGAPMPLGADAIVMVEDTELVEPLVGTGQVAVREAAQVGRHLRAQGEDVRPGERVLTAGTLIRASQVGMLATMGWADVPTVRLPRVAVLSTGDEVVEVETGVIPPRGKIRNSNSYALAALVKEAPAELHSRRHVPDDLAATLAALRACVAVGANGEPAADVIVTAGGVSVGERDYVKPALDALGTLELWRVAMKPGKPLAFGRIGHTLFFGLPGNPVSAQVTFELFVRPTLWKMAGRHADALARRQVTAELLEPIQHQVGRREYLRAITEWRAGRFVTRPLAGQSSANLHALALANSLLIVPEEAPGVEAGQEVSVLLLDGG